MVKYVFVTGGVLSSVGKGTVLSSVGKILQVRGFTVTAIKIDPYLNYDAGTMNPFMHGEVFVTEDGSEADLDLGSYERFLDVDVTRDNYLTTGQIYWAVIAKERKGDYLGQCVQIIPHVTDEIKHRIRHVAEATKVDAVLVEVGGTVGDIEGLPFLEAIRQMRLEEGFVNTLFVHVGLVPILEATGEFKTKPVQHSVQELRRIGIQPDIIVARVSKTLPQDARRKIALFGSVDERAVFYSPTVESLYQIPLELERQGMGEYITERLALPKREAKWGDWEALVDLFVNVDREVKIAMCGKYAQLADSYVSVNEALKHAGALCGVSVKIDWIETEIFEEDPSQVSTLKGYHGVLVPGGFGARGSEGKVMAINYARMNNIPFLGICFGFQLAVVEFARNVLELEGANSTEIDPNTPNPVIDLLPEQREVTEKGATMRLGAKAITVKPNTMAYKLYGSNTIYERHRHRYEINPKYWENIQRHNMVFSGTTLDGTRVEIVELPDHYFYLATQFHPEFKSRPGKPDPAYYGFVKSALDKSLGKPSPEIELKGFKPAALYTSESVS
jgi:CTP synthase